jgi:hypothetical protein
VAHAISPDVRYVAGGAGSGLPVSHRRTLALGILPFARSMLASAGIPHPLRILPALGQQRRLRNTGNPEPSNGRRLGKVAMARDGIAAVKPVAEAGIEPARRSLSTGF